jgi:peptide/nickel transport system substrate-binding protein
MEMEKKNVAIIVLAIALAASGVGNIILGIMAGLIEIAPPTQDTFRVIRGNRIPTIDPADAWDSASNNVLNQVVETLWLYDLREEDLPLIPWLVDSWVWNTGATELQINLKQGIKFHDGEDFDADAVKHTFDRIDYLSNWTGTLPLNTSEMFPSSLYKFDATTPIIADTEVLSKYVINFTLTQAFGPFTSLLAYTASAIVSPNTPRYRYIDLTTERVIGTGPFVYESYIPLLEVRFTRNDNYWQELAHFSEMVFLIIEDATTANNAMLGKDADYLGGCLPDFIPLFKADPDFTFVENLTSLVYWYIAFNTQQVNRTWRKALSYAYNYTHVVEEIRNGVAVRGTSAVPPGMPGHNASLNVAVLNRPFARQIMQAMGYGVGFDINNDAEWLLQASTAPFRDFDVIRHFGSTTSQRLNELFIDNVQYIGCNATERILDWDTFLDVGQNNPDSMNVWYVGWGPDYLDAFNMLDPLFNPASSSNFVQLNDATLIGWLNDLATEPDTDERLKLAGMIQWRLYERLYVHMPLWLDLLYYVHLAEIDGVPYNAMQNFWAYPIYRV